MTDANNTRFNAEAAAWDSNPDVHRASDSALQAILERFPQLTKYKENGSTASEGLEILEIGCGTGLLSFRMSPYVKSILAVDSSSGMISALESKLSAAPQTNNVTPLCIMLEDAEDPRMPSASANGVANGDSTGKEPRKKFDLVLSHLVLHHIPNLPGVLKTMFNALKPGGQIALTDFEDYGHEARRFHPESKMEGVERHGINAVAFTKQIQEAGFVDARCEVGWVMKKDVEAFPGEWGDKKPTDKELKQGDFPFLVCMGKKP